MLDENVDFLRTQGVDVDGTGLRAQPNEPDGFDRSGCAAPFPLAASFLVAGALGLGRRQRFTDPA
jgi:hypothetical protein